MYIKKVKIRNKKYKYYYHNIKVNYKVKNICLGSSKKEALVKLKRLDYPITSILSSLKTKALPLMSFDENSLSNFSIPILSLESSGGCILNNITPGLNFIGYRDVFKKSESLVNKILPCLDANENNSEFFIPLGAYIMLTPLEEINFTKSSLTFSSAKILIYWDKSFTSQLFSSEVQSSFNMSFIQRWIISQNFINICSCFKHFQNLPYHNSGAFKSQFSVANPWIRDYIIINSNNISIHSHTFHNYINKILYLKLSKRVSLSVY